MPVLSLFTSISSWPVLVRNSVVVLVAVFLLPRSRHALSCHVLIHDRRSETRGTEGPRTAAAASWCHGWLLLLVAPNASATMASALTEYKETDEEIAKS